MTDEIERKPASENPWYILMTIAGEQKAGFDPIRHAKNRRFWHGWLAQGLDDGVKADLIAREMVSESDLAPFEEDQQAFWELQIKNRQLKRLPIQEDTIDFSKCEFQTLFSCGGYYFTSYADFRSAVFSGYADFRSAAFSSHTDFRSAKFLDYADFASSTFSEKNVFTNAQFESSVDFEDVTFLTSPPELFGSELHEDTTWLVELWPPVPKDPREAYDHRRAYERLKLLMDSQKKTHDEHMFHRLELKCREVEEGWPASSPSRLYGLVSDYGWSFMRPASFLFFFTCLGYWYFMERLGRLGGCPAALGETLSECRLTVFSLSLSNMFGFLGLGRSVLKDEIEALDDFGWFEVGAGVQFFLGPILLFFLFLALRNRYRMR